MKRKIQAFRKWFNEQSLRERLLMMVVFCGITIAIWDLAFMGPLRNQDTTLHDTVASLRVEVEALAAATSLLADELQKAAGREVAFGELEVSIWSGFGVRVADVSIGEDPAYSDGDFVSADMVEVRVAILPALMGDIQVGRVVLREPSIRVIQTPGASKSPRTARVTTGTPAPRTTPARAARASLEERWTATTATSARTIRAIQPPAACTRTTRRRAGLPLTMSAPIRIRATGLAPARTTTSLAATP